MRSATAIALWTYLIPIGSTRAFRVGILLFILTVALIGLLIIVGVVQGDIARDILSGIRATLVFPGVPLGALLMAEIPLRDGITHRTLLYPLLGPVPRATLAAVRTVATGALLAVALIFLVIIARAFGGGGFSGLERDVLAIVLGSIAYTALFGAVHLVSRRGLIAGLVLVVIFDFAIGRLPFVLRNLAPSYHMSVLGDFRFEFDMPIRIAPPGSSIAVSILVLAALAVLFTAGVAALFSKKNLGELC